MGAGGEVAGGVRRLEGSGPRPNKANYLWDTTLGLVS
jgi:hypothetical protein